MSANAWAEVSVDYGVHPPQWHVKYAWLDGRRDPIRIDVSNELLSAARGEGPIGDAYGWMLRPNGELWLTPDGQHRFRATGERNAYGSIWERVTDADAD